MIKIEKDKYGPDIRYKNHPNAGMLTWKVSENQVIRDYANNPVPFQNGTYIFPNLHRSNEYRDALEECQGSKCCYCEKPLSGGQIEHFRPKKAYQQNIGDPFIRPGYYWLAFRWSNFLMSCGECNQSGRKGNRFPIRGVRALNQTSNLELEQMDLINPAEEEPSHFISFNKEVPIGIDPKGRGELNIEVFDLRNRTDLKSGRFDKFYLYKTTQSIAKLPGPIASITGADIKRAKDILNRAKKSKQPFAGMIRENIKNGFL